MRRGDAFAVIADGDKGLIGFGFVDGDGNAARTGPPCVLQEFVGDIVDGAVKQARDFVDRLGGDRCSDGCHGRWFRNGGAGGGPAPMWWIRRR